MRPTWPTRPKLKKKHTNVRTGRVETLVVSTGPVAFAIVSHVGPNGAASGASDTRERHFGPRRSAEKGVGADSPGSLLFVDSGWWNPIIPEQPRERLDFVSSLSLSFPRRANSRLRGSLPPDDARSVNRCLK